MRTLLFERITSSRCGLICILLMANIICLLLFLLFIPVIYDSTDDVAMCSIANGRFLGVPDCHLVFINALVGKFLVFLYSICQGVEWYAIVLLIAHVISVSVIDYCVLKAQFKPIVQMALLAIVYCFWVRFLTGFQFTTTTALLTIAGCLLLLRNSRISVFSGVLLVVSASLIRFEMTAFICICFFPLWIWEYQKQWIRYGVLVIVAVFCLSLKWSNSCFYQSNNWKTYLSTLNIRFGINDSPNSRVLYGAEIDGISHNDILMVLGTEQDPTTMNISDFEQIRSYVSEKTSLSRWLNIYQMKRLIFPLCVLALLLFVLFIGHPKDSSVWLALTTYGVCVVLLMLICIDRNLKDRVSIPALIPTIGAFFYTLQKVDIHKIQKLVMGILLLLSITGWLNMISINKVRAHSELSHIWDEQRVLMEQHAGPIIWPGDLQEAGMNPFQIFKDEQSYTPAGWLIGAPLPGIFDKHTDFLERNAAIVLSTDYGWDELIISHYVESLREHYGIEVESSYIQSDKYRLYTLHDKHQTVNLNAAMPPEK